jgi:ketosteroid isomerase-like protein
MRSKEEKIKKPIPKFSKIVPLPLLLALLLTDSFSSCSKPNLGDFVREHIEAVNTDDVEKNLTLFTDDIVFEVDANTKIFGKDQLRNLMESDAANKARLTINDIKAEGDTVIVKLTEKNESYRLLGIEEDTFTAIYKFSGRLLEKVKLEGTPEGAKLYDEKYKPFAEWASQERPEEFKKQETGGYTAENCRLYLSLLQEWRDKTSTERLSVEQELIKLEKEWTDAWVKGDVAFFDRIMADDYTWTSPWGEVVAKARNLALVKSGEDVITAWVLAEIKVRAYGDAAVVTGRDTIKETYKGEDVSSQNRWTHTWVKRAGRWQCVAAHSSEIAPK